MFSFLFPFVAGSTGDPNAPQLIVGNRGVQLQYAKEQEKKFEHPVFNDKDWSCEAVCSNHIVAFSFSFCGVLSFD
jgi:hypothetical protein